MDDDWKKKYDAPDGQIWVCAACGKHNKNRVDVGDESCFLNATLCYERHEGETWVAVKKEEK